LYVAITRTRGQLFIPETLLPTDFPVYPNIHVVKAEKDDMRKEHFSSSAGTTLRKQSNQHFEKPKKEQNATYNKKRLMHKNAYQRWTPESDAELKEMYYKGIPLAKIMEHFDRNEGAIVSRLKKVGCIDFEQ